MSVNTLIHSTTLDQEWPRQKGREIKAAFLQLADLWRKDIGDNSCFDEVVTNHYYQEIIGLGEDVIPFLLEDLKQNPFDWLYALRRISGQSPASGIRGVDAIAASWISWGKERGYI